MVHGFCLVLSFFIEPNKSYLWSSASTPESKLQLGLATARVKATPRFQNGLFVVFVI